MHYFRPMYSAHAGAFDIEIKIAGIVEQLSVLRDSNILSHNEYEVYHRGKLLARIWTDHGDEGLRWRSTDLIAGQVLRDIGSAIERHFA
ncbi:hypothetical protein [uncultured Pedobacter sp.]|uniref:hypothetical protein n=1 Tax=uncultured Pedobacter sp. TaxID=246139 RepID=UPI00263725DE|nr:hypothetical protein [uncultured Pedobacter sp.]